MKVRQTPMRKGAVLALVLLCLIPMLTFAALSVDLGLLAIARTQVQNAADAAAMAAARTLNGDSTTSNNSAQVPANATAAMTANYVLGSAIAGTSLTTQIGRYTYNSTNQRFEGQFPGPSTENLSMVRATVSANVQSSMAFSKVLNFTSPNVQAIATAAHRPRDVAIVLDYSGSMRFGSLLGIPPYTNPRSSNNGDSIVPSFGHYSSSSAGLQASGYTSPYIEANITRTTSDGRAPVVTDFYQNASGTLAFSSAATSYGTTPAGDIPLKTNLNTGGSYAQTVAQIMNITTVTNSTYNSSWENNGYHGVTGTTFQGYTQGPGYWGKTFWIWPPDPTNAPSGDPLYNSAGGGPSRDWRERYFRMPGAINTPITDNRRLYDSSGGWQAPGSSTYQINYSAILYWIKNIGPNPFPSRLQAGRILYYDAIPDTIDASTYQPGDLNQRFWKDYIDYCLGLIQRSNGWFVSVDDSQGDSGYGRDYTWGTIRVTSESSLSGTPRPYMHYQDNPTRGRLHFWFGPLSMVDFLGNYNNWYRLSPQNDCSRYCWWPGTCHEYPMYACKLGVRAALNDISNNHPNDLVSLIMFSVPMDAANDTNAGRFNRVRVGLSRDYASMQESLWYPPSTINNPSATVRPYDSNNVEVPRAMGGTCYSMPLMLAYNQFSCNASLRSYNPGQPSGDAGGNGRRGAQKIIIFETDGAPNQTASAGLVSSGGIAQSYYSVRYNSTSPSSSEFPTGVAGYSDNASNVTSQIFSLCTQICAQEASGGGGYSTPTKPVQIHTIGFGPLVDPSSSSRSTIVSTLNQMQTIGNVTDGVPEYKLVYGSESQIVSKLQQAFTQILQSGVQVSLIE